MTSLGEVPPFPRRGLCHCPKCGPSLSDWEAGRCSCGLYRAAQAGMVCKVQRGSELFLIHTKLVAFLFYYFAIIIIMPQKVVLQKTTKKRTTHREN